MGKGRGWYTLYQIREKVCDYCGYDAETKETGYSVTYTDGVDSAEIFEDQSTVVPENAGTPAFNGTPAREGYVFSGWLL